MGLVLGMWGGRWRIGGVRGGALRSDGRRAGLLSARFVEFGWVCRLCYGRGRLWERLARQFVVSMVREG